MINLSSLKFAAASDAPPTAEQQQRERELDARLGLLPELARAVQMRAAMHQELGKYHRGQWLEAWEFQKAGRLLSIAAIMASPEFAGFVRGHAGLRKLFSRDPAPPLPKRPRTVNKRKSRAKPPPAPKFDINDVTTWGSFTELLGSAGLGLGDGGEPPPGV